jgi:rhodanese-related sulfurtransferase
MGGEKPGHGAVRKKNAALVLTGLGALLCLNCSGCATTIAGDLLLKKLQEKPAPLVVDVRSQGEYDQGHIPGAVHIPFYAIDSGLQRLGHAKRDAVVLYCEHGPRAGIASMTLFLFGYKQFFSVEGHMKGWRAAGLPVEKAVR